MFQSRSKPNIDPLAIWLTGGPGCSGEIALVWENGPYILNDDLTLTKNKYSWNNFANLVYVDQPKGTGYSNSSTAEDYV